jgi:phosphoglycolate phosphatase
MRPGQKAVRAAIVDLDGTMIHTLPDFEVALNGMLKDLGRAPVTQAQIALLVGKGSENLVRSVLSLEAGQAERAGLFDDAMAAYQRHYLSVNGDFCELYPEVVAGLKAMQAQGLRLACVTNKPLAFARPLLDRMGLSPFFGILYGGDSFARKKPDPMALLQVCADFGLEPAEVVAIGDSSNDAQAARAAGCYVLTVPYGYNHGQPIHETDSDGIVVSLLDAADKIRHHNNDA